MEILRQGLEYVNYLIDIIGIVIILIGFFKALLAFIRNEVSRPESDLEFWNRIRKLRCGLATYLLLGLDFIIASDIISSMVHPGLEGLIGLGGLVLVRTVIAYFLSQELKELHQAVLEQG